MSAPTDTITSSRILYISYIMFTTAKPLREAGDWILEVHIVCKGVDDDREVYCINSSGNIDSISPSMEFQHEHTLLNREVVRCIRLDGRVYYGGEWVHIDETGIDRLVFSNLTDEETSKLINDLKCILTEVLL